MAHSSKNGTFIQKWHIQPKMAHSSKNGIFIQKQDIYPNIAHVSKNCTVILKSHTYSKIVFFFKASRRFSLRRAILLTEYWNCYKLSTFKSKVNSNLFSTFFSFRRYMHSRLLKNCLLNFERQTAVFNALSLWQI